MPLHELLRPTPRWLQRDNIVFHLNTSIATCNTTTCVDNPTISLIMSQKSNLKLMNCINSFNGLSYTLACSNIQSHGKYIQAIIHTKNHQHEKTNEGHKPLGNITYANETQHQIPQPNG